MTKQIKEKFDKIIKKSLMHPDSIDSKDFVFVYNTIFKHCTQPSNTYEIRGSDVYDILSQILNNFTTNLEFKSLQSYKEDVSTFKKSVVMIEKMFSYLERYYIKIGLERRDHNIRKIENLMYFYYYQNFFEKIESQILLYCRRGRFSDFLSKSTTRKRT